MDAKEIEVRCPCCTARLWVEPGTGRVLRTVEAEEAPGPAKDRWESAEQKVRERTRSGADKLESALEAERTKESRFDDLFQKAREKHRREPEI